MKSRKQLEKLLRAATKYPDSWNKDLNDGELTYVPGKIKLYPATLKLRVNDISMDHPRMYLSLFTSLYIRIRVGLAVNKRCKEVRNDRLDAMFTGVCKRLLGIENND